MSEHALRFGSNGELYGTYHAPAGPARGFALVFCPAFAEEAKCSYRTFVEAARAFAQSGVPCLRFDYFGTGDSAGDFREFAPSRAIDDIVTASDKARELAACNEVRLLGLRLGGTLALAAAPRAGAARVILWQPVLDGRPFFDLNIRRQLLRRQLTGSASVALNGVPGDTPPDSEAIDLDGYALSHRAAGEIRSLDGLALARACTCPVNLLQISHTESISREHHALAEALLERATLAAVVCEPFWNRIDLSDASPVIDRTLDWLTG